MGYIVEQKSPYHFRIRQEENDNFIDFWPTRKKYVKNINSVMHWPVQYYTDIRLTAEDFLP